MSKKRISANVDEAVNKELEVRAKQLGISKSALVAFSTTFFLDQLEHLEKTAASQDIHTNVYQILKNNMDMKKDWS
ncbi:hypothetical protein ABID56_001103 [Alkalibacillus flavidus]|uniref:CopG family transcriptional regulator n=1 Tax=Alkalibacillus flavidus TaxID=546021 RepID=A0ABV2KTV8_9BACI